jgi:hypothetical protein
LDGARSSASGKSSTNRAFLNPSRFDEITGIPFPHRQLAHISDQELFCSSTTWALHQGHSLGNLWNPLFSSNGTIGGFFMKLTGFERKTFFAFLFIFLMSPSLVGADAIVLKNGNRIEPQRVWNENYRSKGLLEKGLPVEDLLNLGLGYFKRGGKKPHSQDLRTGNFAKPLTSDRRARCSVLRRKVEVGGGGESKFPLFPRTLTDIPGFPIDFSR